MRLFKEMRQATQSKAMRLNAVGIVGNGTIVGVRDTGTTINDYPELELDVIVTIPGREPYRVTHRQVIARIAIGSFQAGAEVRVCVDPDDPNEIIVA